VSTFPVTRLRRLRRTTPLRELVRETTVSLDDLVMPLFVAPAPLANDRLPALSRHTVDSLVREVRPNRDLAALIDLARLIGRVRPDIVHTHSSKAGIVGRLAARLAGVRSIVHSIHGFGFHDGQPAPVRRAFIAAERCAGRVTHRFIAVSRANREAGVGLGIFERERCEVIRSGIELAKFREGSKRPGTLRRELGLGESEPLVGMIACLKPQKAPLDFVEVARRVLAEEPCATFVLAGDGELRPEVERAAAEVPGGRGRIRLLGWRRDAPAILADLDVLLLTSRWEGLPRVVPEAMAAGKPVVATAVDGTPEAVEDGLSGYLTPPGDTRAMAARVLALLRDRTLRSRMGEAGARRAGEWDIDEMVRAQERLYDALLEGVARPAGSRRLQKTPVDGARA